jgi:hypothetical protein
MEVNCFLNRNANGMNLTWLPGHQLKTPLLWLTGVLFGLAGKGTFCSVGTNAAALPHWLHSA